jgi:hypothetical protein
MIVGPDDGNATVDIDDTDGGVCPADTAAATSDATSAHDVADVDVDVVVADAVVVSSFSISGGTGAFDQPVPPEVMTLCHVSATACISMSGNSTCRAV